MTTLFIDGFHGTVGMALQPHLADLLAEGLVSRVIVLDKQAARDEQRRAEVMREADVVVFCVPDEVAPSAVALAQAVNPKARLLDASAAYRCDPDWLYGLQELSHPDFRNAPRVANPGCFATGCILLAWMVYFSVAAPGWALQGLLITVFVLLTAPVVSMMLMRAAVSRDPELQSKADFENTAKSDSKPMDTSGISS